MSSKTSTDACHAIDPVMTAIIANRIDGIIREMTNTLQRAARSAVINSCRDFSCAICTGDNRLLACAEGLPIHIFGVHMQAQAMCELHADIAEGDAYLDNDPYLGNTHPADHTFLVPVFVDDEHLFTAVAKAHQADIGNSVPTTYHATARDVYEEGALIFPSVRIQRGYQMIEDIVRMCRSRIRVPTQWYGDFLAGIGAVRIAERRLKELCAKYGKETIKTFNQSWLDYSAERMAQAIRRFPKGHVVNTTRHDPIEPLFPDGIPIRIGIEIDPEAATITVDLRDNIDNIECGLNMSEACTTASVLAGIFNSLDPTIPHNSGSFRHVQVLMREGAVIGRPKFPHSCSVATTNLANRVIACTGSAFAKLRDGYGLAEGGVSFGPGGAVVSGKDHRFGDEPYINELILGNPGGPASPFADGWVTYGMAVSGGLIYRESIEICENKHPIEFRHMRLVPGTGGAGKFRGGLAFDFAYGPREHPMTVLYPCDAQQFPPRGVRGGADGICSASWHIDTKGAGHKLPTIVQIEVPKGEYIRGLDSSGGGYGNPLDRDPKRVLHDVVEGLETRDRAVNIYGVILAGDAEDETLAIDMAATQSMRLQIGRGTRAYRYVAPGADPEKADANAATF